MSSLPSVTLVAVVLGSALAACSSSPPRPSNEVKASATVSSSVRPSADSGYCQIATASLHGVQTLADASSATFDAAAQQKLAGVVDELRKLANIAPDAITAAAARRLVTDLSGLAGLARADPRGQQPQTRQRAQQLAKDYQDSYQQLNRTVAGMCQSK